MKKLAVCNRGEVAVRIIQAAHEMGLKTVLLHSAADAESLAARLSDEAVSVGPAPTLESYLNIEANIKAAVTMGADLVHPGFGFLSENADFAQSVEDAGLVFVGPRPQTLRDLGDKITAKKMCDQLGVPTVPGFTLGAVKAEDVLPQLEAVGLPCVIKAAAGGGGRGMKVVHRPEDFSQALESAQREALSAFGSEKVFVERYLENPKHIEVQIFGDGNDQYFHLFERECSVQRRHQKVIEEAPAANISDDLRYRLCQASLKIAKANQYRSAGTVEFLVERRGDKEEFFFLEVNTRLQVEHPVTEWVCGVDLVKAQLNLALGKRAPDWQPSFKGHAIECRLLAEDPYKQGLPSTGKIYDIVFPHGPGRRFDVGVVAGDSVSEFYDSMIGKIIVWDENRLRAIDKMLHVLENTVVFGVNTNIPFPQAILSHPEFQAGTMTTHFLQKHFAEGLSPQSLPEDAVEFAKKAFSATHVTGISASPFVKGWRVI